MLYLTSSFLCFCVFVFYSACNSYIPKVISTPDITENAAKLRADYNLRTPDAIQMATAIYGGASFFFMNNPG